MRIIAGTAKGRRLAAPKGVGVRPTPERVREAVFDILGEAIGGASFLDVFAGTGALSAEALSRGASCAFLLEREPNALRILRRNLETAGFARDRWRVLPGDALACLRRLRRQGRTFDVIFLDPPYASGLGGKALLGLASLLEPDGVAILEHEAKKSPPEVSDLRLVETRKFGDTAISFFQRRGGD